ncbi:hypothetical protein KKD71_00640 [Patescibacteria group bacterium]|nr:hypothetical protein [Patescibacteria group bacterium]
MGKKHDLIRKIQERTDITPQDKEALIRQVRQQSARATGKLVGTSSAGLKYGKFGNTVIHPGEVGVRFKYGQPDPQLKGGLQVDIPGISYIIKVSTRIRTMKLDFSLPTNSTLVVSFSLLISYRIDPADACYFAQEGEDEQISGCSLQIREIIRRIIREQDELYILAPEFARSIKGPLIQSFEIFHLMLIEVLVTNQRPPPEIVQALSSIRQNELKRQVEEGRRRVIELEGQNRILQAELDGIATLIKGQAEAMAMRWKDQVELDNYGQRKSVDAEVHAQQVHAEAEAFRKKADAVNDLLANFISTLKKGMDEVLRKEKDE